MTKLSAFFLFILISFIPAEVKAQDTDRPWIYKDMSNQLEIKNSDAEIRGGDLVLLSKISAISTTQNAYDVYAPFDGRIEEIHVELFDTVDTDTKLATEFTTELAAMVDATPENSKNQTRRRWQDIFKPYYIKPEEKGIITKIHVTPNTQVYAGDRLFTVSRKVLMIGRNTEPIYNPLLTGMTAQLEHFRTGDMFDAKLARYIPIKDKPYFYRLWLEVLDIKKGLAIGEQFDGNLIVAKSIGTRVVKRKNLLRHNGKKYVIMEVETGLETEDEIELIRPITRVLNWEYITGGEPLPQQSEEKGKVKKEDNRSTQGTSVKKAAEPAGTPTVIMSGGQKTGTAKKKNAARKKNAVKKPNTAKKKNTGKNAKKVRTAKGAAGKKAVAAPAVKTPATADSISFVGVDGSTADQVVQETSAPERTPEAKAQAGLGDTDVSGVPGTASPAQQEQTPPATASPTGAKPMDVKVEGESDTKVFTSPNDAVSNDFLEGED